MYKVFEVSPVDESTLEEALNRGLGEGFKLARVDYVMQAGVRRPTLAYVIMFRASSAVEGGEEEADEGGAAAEGVEVSDPGAPRWP